MRKALLAAVVACNCTSAEVELASRDAEVDVTDTAPPALDTGTYVYPDAVNVIDGAPVRGHDEDSDGFIDEIDNCPLIANPDDNKGFAPKPIGDSCKPVAPFADVEKRTFFDAFTRARPMWNMSGGTGVFAFRDDLPDLMSGGEAARSHRVAYTSGVGPPAGKPVVVTAVMQTVASGGDPAIGVFARASSDGRSYIGCNRLNLWVTPKGGCPIADDCEIVQVASKKPPNDLEKVSVYGLRLSIRDTEAGVLAECRMFDPNEVATVNGADIRYAVTTTFPAGTVNDAGEVGVFAHHGGVFVYAFEVATSK
jgi:hypothetical protein